MCQSHGQIRTELGFIQWQISLRSILSDTAFITPLTSGAQPSEIPVPDSVSKLSNFLEMLTRRFESSRSSIFKKMELSGMVSCYLFFSTVSEFGAEEVKKDLNAVICLWHRVEKEKILSTNFIKILLFDILAKPRAASSIWPPEDTFLGILIDCLHKDNLKRALWSKI